MPVLGRFLLGSWITPDAISAIISKDDNTLSWEGQYSDTKNNIHKRRITQKNNLWIIEDMLSGNFKTATIGFNLLSDKLSTENNVIRLDCGEIHMSADTKFEIMQNFISDYYWERHSSNRLIIHLSRPTTITTTIRLNS